MTADVAIGYICDQGIDSEFISSLHALMSQRIPDIKNRVIQARGHAGRLDIGRHIIVQVFLEQTDAEYLLMIDSDMVFTVQDYDELVRSMQATDELKIMSGLYAREDGSLCVFDMTEDGYAVTDPTQLMHKKFYQADAVGLGFTLVPRTLLEQMQGSYGEYDLPWFDVTEDGGQGWRLADDTSFCLRATDIDAKVYVNLQVKVGHLKQVVIYPKLESQLAVPQGLVVP